MTRQGTLLYPKPRPRTSVTGGARRRRVILIPSLAMVVKGLILLRGDGIRLIFLRGDAIRWANHRST